MKLTTVRTYALLGIPQTSGFTIVMMGVVITNPETNESIQLQCEFYLRGINIWELRNQISIIDSIIDSIISDLYCSFE